MATKKEEQHAIAHYYRYEQQPQTGHSGFSIVIRGGEERVELERVLPMRTRTEQARIREGGIWTLNV